MSRSAILSALLSCMCAPTILAMDVPQIDIHGFVSEGYLKSDRNNYLGESQAGSFDFNEAAINFQSQLSQNLHVGVQFFARDLDGIGKDRVGIDWAYFDYHQCEEIGLRVGQVKVPRGLYNKYFDLDVANPTVLLPQAVYDQRLRDFLISVEGASIYGNLGLGVGGSFDYEVFGGTRTLENDGSVAAYFRNAEYSSTTDFSATSLSLRRMYGGSLTWNTPLRGLRGNVSYLQFDDLAGSGSLTGFAPVPVPIQIRISRGQNVVMGTEYEHSRLRLASELTLWNMDYDIAGTSGVIRWGGWYVQAAYQVLAHWGLALTYGEFYDDRTQRRGQNRSQPKQGYQHDASVSLRYDPLTCLTLKAEVHYLQGWAQMFAQDNPRGVSGDTILLALKSTVTF